MILVFGSVNMDLIAQVETIARPGETVLAPGYAMRFGGKGANQAVAAGRAAQQPVGMVGAVGDDAFGRLCLDNLNAHGVDTGLVQHVDAPSGVAFITVDASGENAITVASGANRLIAAEKLPALTGEPPLCILQMEVPVAENIRCAERVKTAGGRVILNLAPANLNPASEVAHLLSLTDILVVNEHEAAALLASGIVDGKDAADLARQLAVDLVLTRGGAGVDLFPLAGEPAHIAAERVQIVDTTGAGDTFVGALAAGIAAGRPMIDALAAANRAAALCCTWHGAQPEPA